MGPLAALPAMAAAAAPAAAGAAGTAAEVAAPAIGAGAADAAASAAPAIGAGAADAAGAAPAMGPIASLGGMPNIAPSTPAMPSLAGASADPYSLDPIMSPWQQGMGKVNSTINSPGGKLIQKGLKGVTGGNKSQQGQGAAPTNPVNFSTPANPYIAPPTEALGQMYGPPMSKAFYGQ
jgi:hypothetical protein